MQSMKHAIKYAFYSHYFEPTNLHYNIDQKLFVYTYVYGPKITDFE